MNLELEFLLINNKDFFEILHYNSNRVTYHLLILYPDHEGLKIIISVQIKHYLQMIKLFLDILINPFL